MAMTRDSATRVATKGLASRQGKESSEGEVGMAAPPPPQSFLIWFFFLFFSHSRSICLPVVQNILVTSSIWCFGREMLKEKDLWEMRRAYYG